MKNRKALRVGAVLWAGIGLLALATVSFLVAGQVDDATGALVGQGMIISQGALLRALAVVDAGIGIWVLVRPRASAGLVAALVAGIGLSLIPRFGTATIIPIGQFDFDARILIIALQAIVVAAGVGVAFFWLTRAKSPSGRASA